ncbi:MAG: protein translocase subunit SecD [Candidatus Colwellbacteria bacterium]|nr:protein translocase subunit SecD [Candidatus Colwellbacteria bacterium]
MKSWKISLFILVFVILLSVLAGFFVYPRYFGSKYLPWRLGLDLVGGTSLVYQVDLSGIPADRHDDTVAGLKEVIEKRVNIFGVTEPKVTIAQKGDNYELLVDLAGVKDLKEAVRLIGETPILDFREVVQIDDQIVYVPTELTGRYIKSANIAFDQLNKPIVTLEFNEEGAKLFEEITARNVGKPLAIFLDNEIKDAPIVQEKITGGRAQISGGGAGFSADEARTLVERFNAGALAAPIKLINQRTVSPTAATDALRDIITAGLIGTALVALFMIIYYRLFGIFAVLALSIYAVLALALFKVIPNFTMTLAGIAGFILSIGMAVDANILIFERTKEEKKRGLAREEAIEEGFRRAWPSIRDSNMSTIITSAILYYFTTSFVKGFALTLGLGVLVSMFSAILITRTMLRVFLEKNGKTA